MKLSAYVYTIVYNGLVVYVGKGTGNRVNSDKNVWFNLFDEALDFDREVVKEGLTDKEALSLEGKLIRKYKPIFNLNDGLSPKKWIKLKDKDISDMLDIKRMISKGAESETPEPVAQQMAEHLDDVSSLLIVGDRFSNMLSAFLNRFLNFEGTITVVERDKERVMAIYDAIEGYDHVDVKVIPKSFLEVDFKDQRFDYVIMNPPFNVDGKQIWKRFLDKAKKIAEETITLQPKAQMYGFEHKVLIEHVEFDTTSRPGKVIHFKADAVKVVRAKEKLKIEGVQFARMADKGFDYQRQTPADEFLAFSRSSKYDTEDKVFSNEYQQTGDHWVIFGENLSLIKRLVLDYDLITVFNNFKSAKSKNQSGIQVALTKSYMIKVINDAWDHHNAK